jgi:hypothetical protein
VGSLARFWVELRGRHLYGVDHHQFRVGAGLLITGFVVAGNAVVNLRSFRDQAFDTVVRSSNHVPGLAREGNGR